MVRKDAFGESRQAVVDVVGGWVGREAERMVSNGGGANRLTALFGGPIGAAVGQDTVLQMCSV